MVIASGVLQDFRKARGIACGSFALFFLAVLFTPKAHAAGRVYIVTKGTSRRPCQAGVR